MTGNRPDQIEQLLEEALARPPDERAAFLEDACSDVAMREEVASLAAAYEEADGLFDDVASAVAGLALGALQEHEREQDETGKDASDPLELEGKQVRRYAIEKHLGGGGMGVVYRARDTRLDRPVALKFLPPYLSASAEAKQRFIREARSSSALDHSNIGTIHEVSETKTAVGQVSAGQLFIAMTHYDGETLKAKIARGPLSVEEAVNYAAQIAEGLCRAHEAGIVHRDVKPANVIVTEEGTVKLVDFGLARAAGQSDLTRTGQALGTAAYMSPEQARGEAVDSRTDIWSLGSVLYEMLTGRRPFGGGRPEAVIYAILHENPEPLSECRPKVSAALAAVIERCLKKDPADRYPDTATLLDDLQAVRNGQKPPTQPSYRRIPISNPIRLAITAVLVLGAALSWTFWSAGPDPIDAVAVLPLTSPSGDPTEDYFTHGMTEALTMALSRVGALSVRSSASAGRYADTEKTLPVIAQELGVDALVLGSVFQADGRVRIIIRLVHGSSEEQLWSESFEQDYQDVLALQSEVARAVAKEIHVALSPEEAARLANTRPVTPEAHRQWMIGNYYLTLQDEATFRKALDAYQEAIDIDPGYAHAYAGMALAYTELGSWHASIPPEDVFPQAEAAARRALALDSTVAEAHIALARVQQMYTWDWAGADRAFRRGIALNPSSTPARLYYADYLTQMRRFEEAIAFGRETLTRDPLSPVAHTTLAFPLMFAGREEEALALCQEALEFTDHRQLHVVLALLYARGNRPEKVLYHLAKLEETDEEQLALGWGFSGYLYAVAGQRAEARSILNWLMERRKDEYIPALALACVHLGLGEYDEALRWLDEAVAQRHPTAILINPPWQWFDPVRSDLRFQALRRQMGFPPSQVTKTESGGRRAEPLSSRDGYGVQRASTAEPLSGPSVVVLPLENLSGDSTQAYFADGMTGAIIANLTRIEALHVISRRTAMRYKGSDVPLPAIAGELGVQYVVDGTVFPTVDSVRITASLVEAATDRTLWTKSFTREMRGVLGLQRAVARAVVEGIKVELSPETEARLAEAPEVNPAAYRHYQRGVQIRAEERGGWRRAREHFERAVAVDPSFALGWAWLAKMHAILGTTGARTEENLQREAEAAVQKALALDRDLAEAYVALGLIREILNLDGAAAEQAFVRALELEPGNQEARYEYGMLLMRMGRMDAALAEMERAQAVDPFSMHVHHGMIQVYAFSHRFEEAIQQAERALDIEPGDLESMSRLARTYVFAGRFEEAEAAYRRLEAMDGVGDYEGSFWEAYLHAKKGQPAKARAWIEARENDIAPWAPFWIAWLYAGSGEIDLAVDTLEKAYQTQPNRWNFVFLKALPAFDPLRGEPRFQALVAKTHLG